MVWDKQIIFLLSSLPLPIPYGGLMLRWVNSEHFQGANLAENVWVGFVGLGFGQATSLSWPVLALGRRKEARLWHWGSRDMRSAVALATSGRSLRFSEQKGFILAANIRMVAQDDVCITVLLTQKSYEDLLFFFLLYKKLRPCTLLCSKA